MKNLILIVTFFLLSLTIQAQEKYGIKAGSSLTTIQNYYDGHHKLGFHAGFTLNSEVTRHISIQTELLYAIRGANNGNMPLTMHYADAPIFVRVTLNKFFIEGGPQFSVLLFSRYGGAELAQEAKSSFMKTNIGWLAGIGIRPLPVIDLGLRYAFGGTQVIKLKSDTQPVGFQLYLNYWFNRKG